MYACLHTAEFRTGDIRPVAARIPAEEIKFNEFVNGEL